MTYQYIQHNHGNLVHIVRDTSPSGTYKTYCGKWYTESMSRLRDLGEHREEDLVCYECRDRAARRVGKRVYHQPQLRHGIAKTKQKYLQQEIAIWREKQRLVAWNRNAQEMSTRRQHATLEEV